MESSSVAIEPEVDTDSPSALYRQCMRWLDDIFTVFQKAADDQHLSIPQAKAINRLEPGKSMPMGELADLLRCDPSNVTGIIHRLEDAGLVARHAGTDRRIKELILTEKGIQVRRHLISQTQANMAIATNLNSEQQQQLHDLLETALR